MVEEVLPLSVRAVKPTLSARDMWWTLAPMPLEWFACVPRGNEPSTSSSAMRKRSTPPATSTRRTCAEQNSRG